MLFYCKKISVSSDKRTFCISYDVSKQLTRVKGVTYFCNMVLECVFNNIE